MFRCIKPGVSAALLLCVCSHPAAAQDGLYLFGAAGNADSDVGLGGQNRTDDDDSSYMFGVGYAFTENVSIEGAFHDFGSHASQTDCPPGFACLVVPLLTQADITAFSLSLVGSYPLNDRWDVYGKLGVTSWDVEFAGISSAFDDSGEDLHYGAGLRWSIDDRWKLFAEYERVDLDLDGLSIGIRFDF